MTIKPVHAIVALGVAALALGGKKKPAQPAAFSYISLTPTSIHIKDEVKASQYILTKSKEYAHSLKSLQDFSYIDLVGKIIAGINPSVYQVYKTQKLDKNGTLIVTYLSGATGAAFNTIYFGDMSKYVGNEEGYMTEDLLNDPAYLKWEEFRDKIAPEKLGQFYQFVGYKEEMKNELFNVTEIIKVNDKYPV